MSSKVDIEVALQTSAVSAGLSKLQGEVSKFSHHVTSQFTGMFTGAALAAGLEQLAEHLVRVGHLAERFGESVEAIQRVDFAAKEKGADIELVARAMSKLKVAAVSAADAGGKLAAKFELLGIDAQKFAAAGLQEKLILLSKAFVDAQGNTSKEAALMSLLGNRAQDLIPVIAQGPEKLAESMGHVSVATEDAVKAATEFHETTLKFKSEALPIVSAILKVFNAIAAVVHGIGEALGGFVVAGLDAMGKQAAAVGAAFDKLKHGDFKGAFGELGNIPKSVGGFVDDVKDVRANANKKGNEDLHRIFDTKPETAPSHGTENFGGGSGAFDQNDPVDESADQIEPHSSPASHAPHSTPIDGTALSTVLEQIDAIKQAAAEGARLPITAAVEGDKPQTVRDDAAKGADLPITAAIEGDKPETVRDDAAKGAALPITAAVEGDKPATVRDDAAQGADLPVAVTVTGEELIGAMRAEAEKPVVVAVQAPDLAQDIAALQTYIRGLKEARELEKSSGKKADPASAALLAAAQHLLETKQKLAKLDDQISGKELSAAAQLAALNDKHAQQANEIATLENRNANLTGQEAAHAADLAQADELRIGLKGTELEIQKAQAVVDKEAAQASAEAARDTAEKLKLQEQIADSTERIKETQAELNGATREQVESMRTAYEFDKQIKAATDAANQAWAEGKTQVAETNEALEKQLRTEKQIALAAIQTAEAQARLKTSADTLGAQKDNLSNTQFEDDAIKKNPALRTDSTALKYELDIHAALIASNEARARAVKLEAQGNTAEAAIEKHTAGNYAALAKTLQTEASLTKLDQEKDKLAAEQQKRQDERNGKFAEERNLQDQINAALEKANQLRAQGNTEAARLNQQLAETLQKEQAIARAKRIHEGNVALEAGLASGSGENIANAAAQSALNALQAQYGNNPNSGTLLDAIKRNEISFNAVQQAIASGLTPTPYNISLAQAQLDASATGHNLSFAGQLALDQARASSQPPVSTNPSTYLGAQNIAAQNAQFLAAFGNLGTSSTQTNQTLTATNQTLTGVEAKLGAINGNLDEIRRGGLLT